MRANTQQIFERMSKGGFLSDDSTDQEVKHLYDDIEENYADYEAYFSELGLRLESGDGYYYFARTQEAKQTIEQKLQSFAQWVDILDFLKTYDCTMGGHIGLPKNLRHHVLYGISVPKHSYFGAY